MVKKIADLDGLWNKLKSSSDSLLICDYDGTLSPFVENRFEAIPYPGIESLLKRILEAGSRVAIVTGRPTDEIRSLFSLAKELEIWGSHGMERQLPSGEIESIPLDPENERALNAAFEQAVKAGWKDRLDRKHGSIAFHWRGFPEAEIAKMRSEISQVWSAVSRNKPLIIREFDGGLELRTTGKDKGSAVRRLLKDFDLKNPVAYLGDDLTDEDAFAALEGKGCSILVREEFRETKAAYWIKPPDELRQFLNNWVECLL